MQELKPGHPDFKYSFSQTSQHSGLFSTDYIGNWALQETSVNKFYLPSPM